MAHSSTHTGRAMVLALAFVVMTSAARLGMKRAHELRTASHSVSHSLSGALDPVTLDHVDELTQTEEMKGDMYISFDLHGEEAVQWAAVRLQLATAEVEGVTHTYLTYDTDEEVPASWPQTFVLQPSTRVLEMKPARGASGLAVAQLNGAALMMYAGLPPTKTCCCVSQPCVVMAPSQCPLPAMEGWAKCGITVALKRAIGGFQQLDVLDRWRSQLDEAVREMSIPACLAMGSCVSECSQASGEHAGPCPVFCSYQAESSSCVPVEGDEENVAALKARRKKVDEDMELLAQRATGWRFYMCWSCHDLWHAIADGLGQLEQGALRLQQHGAQLGALHAYGQQLAMATGPVSLEEARLRLAMLLDSATSLKGYILRDFQCAPTLDFSVAERMGSLASGDKDDWPEGCSALDEIFHTSFELTPTDLTDSGGDLMPQGLLHPIGPLAAGGKAVSDSVLDSQGQWDVGQEVEDVPKAFGSGEREEVFGSQAHGVLSSIDVPLALGGHPMAEVVVGSNKVNKVKVDNELSTPKRKVLVSNDYSHVNLGDPADLQRLFGKLAGGGIRADDEEEEGVEQRVFMEEQRWLKQMVARKRAVLVEMMANADDQ